MKKITVCILLLFVFLGTVVNAKDLYYEGTTSDVLEEDVNGLLFTSYNNASANSKAKYSQALENEKVDEWGYVSDRSPNTVGGNGYFSEYYMAFHPNYDYVTEYNSGFNENVDNKRYINAYYDSSDRDLNLESEYHPSSFDGMETNVEIDQKGTTTGFLKAFIFEGNEYIRQIKWKVVNDAIRVDLKELVPDGLQKVLERYSDVDLVNDGLRFSMGLRTKDNFKYKDNMDSSWKFLQSTVNSWVPGTRGFEGSASLAYNQVGPYRAGGSGLNEFDNILRIPSIPSTNLSRKVYVNHITDTGVIMSGFQFTSATVKNGSSSSTRNSVGGTGYQESYTISGNDIIQIKAQGGVKSFNGKNYTFSHGSYAKGSNASNAQYNLNRGLSEKFSENPKGFSVNFTENVNDAIVINLVYSSEVPPDITGNLQKLSLIGRLLFINEKGQQYSSSTTGDRLDYVPATSGTVSQLTPYIQGANPYVVRALAYRSESGTSSKSATVTANIKVTYEVCSKSSNLKCSTTVHTHGVCNTPPNSCSLSEHKHSDGCYELDHDDDVKEHTDSKDFTYKVPYSYTYYKLTNFKMFRITKMEVSDDDGNTGGTLFSGGKYTVYPSTKYESRFSDGGIQGAYVTVTFEDKSFNLTNQSTTVSCAKDPSNGKSTSASSLSDAEALANEKLDEVTFKSASDKTNLTITYDYANDYVILDSQSDMLRQNRKYWSERIDTANNYSRTLDATKTGSGSTNSDASNGNFINYTGNLDTFMRNTKYNTTKADWQDNYQTIPTFRDNGVRTLRGRIYYDVVTDSRYNIGGNAFSSRDYTYTINGSSYRSVIQNDMATQHREYKEDDVNSVNVMTPVNFGDFELVTDKNVDHSSGAGNSTILQKNADFTIKPTTGPGTQAGYKFSDTREFVKGYYFTFDFEVLYKGKIVKPYTPIYVAGANSSITAKTTNNFGENATNQFSNSIKIVAVTTNVTAAMQEYLSASTFTNTRYTDSFKNVVRTSGPNQQDYASRKDLDQDAYHAITKVITTKNIGRIFDFAVTDCSDIDYKNVFRKDSGGAVNKPTGISYYSGYRKWDFSNPDLNNLPARPTSEIGSAPKRILPLGPYKHTNTSYVKAPKMGYRISFDLKTTGFIGNNNKDNSRRIEITPSYYYISKDGRIFDDNIELYYKKANSNYVKLAGSGYTMYFTPNDGYRYLRNSIYTDDFSSMSTKLEPINITKTFTLTSKMMSTSNTSFLQSWYGEFKLPNSTIAVSKNTGSANNNINNPYKDGYIGVKFDIKCVDNGGFTISYNTNDKSTGGQNTSQWDYEGFMNFSSPGSALSNTLNMQLEKDVWRVDNAMYQKVKGSVVLFDLDNRAANDFE